jgi:hypothetical protein
MSKEYQTKSNNKCLSEQSPQTLSEKALLQELLLWKRKALNSEYKLIQLAAIPSDSPEWKKFKRTKAEELLNDYYVDTGDAE